MNPIIKQKGYADIEIDNSEKDIIIFWGVDPKGKDSQIIQLRRENVVQFMSQIQLCQLNQK